MYLYHLFVAGFFLIFFCVSVIRNRALVNSASYLFALYILSVLGGMFLDKSLAAPGDVYSIYASFSFMVLVLLYVSPALVLNSGRISSVQVINYKLFNIIGWFFIIMACFSYLYFVPKIYSLFQLATNIKEARGNLVGQATGLSSNYFYLIITFSCQFYPIVILMFFHSTCYQPNKKVFNNLLLFASTSYIVNVLSNVGRDGFVLWTMSFIFSFILYRSLLPTNLKKKIGTILKRFLVFFLIIFFIISYARFYRDGSAYFFFQYLLLYFAQQFGEFNRFLHYVHNVPVDVGRIFPVFDFFLDNERKNFLVEHQNFLANYGFSKNVFKTFIGMFYESLGAKVTWVSSLVISSVGTALMFLGSRKNVNFGKLIVFTAFMQIPLHGIFYYKLGYMVSNIYFVSCIFLMIVFAFDWKFKGAK